MMHMRSMAIKLAIFTVFTIAVTVWLASVIGNLHLFSQPYEVKAEFSDATGLLVGDVVKAAGVTVGRVSDVRVTDGIAVVSLQIDDGVELPAHLGAEIRFRNLIGQRMVTLVSEDLAGVAAPSSTSPYARTEGGDLIPLERTQPAFDLTALFNGLRPLLQSTNPADINAVTASLNQALSGRRKEIEDFLSNVAALSDTISSRDRQLTTLLDNVNVVTDDLAGRNDQLQRTLSNVNVFLTEVAATRGDLDRALVTLDDATNRLQGVVAANDEALTAELDDLATILHTVNSRRADLRSVIRNLPGALKGVERVAGYGQWAMVHIINVCKDDLGTCGSRWRP